MESSKIDPEEIIAKLKKIIQYLEDKEEKINYDEKELSTSPLHRN